MHNLEKNSYKNEFLKKNGPWEAIAGRGSWIMCIQAVGSS
jgi:hypothetical protein